MTQKELARILGLSESAVSQLAKRGMPTHSAEAARAWRLARIAPYAKRARRAPEVVPASADQQAMHLVARAQRTMELAADLLQAGNLEAVREALQADMRAVPDDHRHRLLVDLNVMNALVSAVLARLQAAQAVEGFGGSAEMTETEAEIMGAWWYAVACGELVVA